MISIERRMGTTQMLSTWLYMAAHCLHSKIFTSGERSIYDTCLVYTPSTLAYTGLMQIYNFITKCIEVLLHDLLPALSADHLL